jgi:electron transfer flavoprotein alpha/beta subunit
MDIVVLVKQVPNTMEVKLDPKTGNLIREGIESIINPDDSRSTGGRSRRSPWDRHRR